MKGLYYSLMSTSMIHVSSIYRERQSLMEQAQ